MQRKTWLVVITSTIFLDNNAFIPCRTNTTISKACICTVTLGFTQQDAASRRRLRCAFD
jgi:hypothetical protein